jgi:phosphinothricin acetyltransferase
MSEPVRPISMNPVSCEPARHSAAILAIFNDAIATSTALYDYQPRAPESMVTWFDAKARGRHPVIGIENEAGELMGFASYGPFRAWPAYKYTIEHSIYVDARFRGFGVGRRLLTDIIAAAERQDYHVMVGGIDAANATSIKLHESLGFTHSGTVKHAGFKFGRWLDLAFYQRILATPSTPIDG